jgi:hypothetical protein
MDDFMNRDQWAKIYDIARYNGYAAHQLVVELCAANPEISESELFEATKEWSHERESSWQHPRKDAFVETERLLEPYLSMDRLTDEQAARIGRTLWANIRHVERTTTR